jgi:competence protein ComEC
MGLIALLALATGRARVATSALAAAAIGGLLLDPALAASPGFALSVLATGALVLLAPGWRDRLRERGVPPGLAEALAVPAAAQVACAPVIVALSGEVSLVAVPANLLAGPAVPPATVLGVGAAVVSPVWPDGAGALAWLASWPARWLVLVAHTGARLPGATVPWAMGWVGALLLALAVGAIWFAARHPASRRVVLVVLLGLVAGAAPVRWLAPGWPPTGVVMVACDVGQGDAIVLPTSPDAAVVVDAGPDPVTVNACLRRLGITAVELVALSHFHADHIDGLAGVLRGRRVGGIATPTFGEPRPGQAQVRAAAADASVSVLEVGPGWTYRQGDVELSVLGPSRAITGSRSDPNNNSLILHAQRPWRRAAFARRRRDRGAARPAA